MTHKKGQYETDPFFRKDKFFNDAGGLYRQLLRYRW
jgi:hypothetical protein